MKTPPSPMSLITTSWPHSWPTVFLIWILTLILLCVIWYLPWYHMLLSLMFLTLIRRRWVRSADTLLIPGMKATCKCVCEKDSITVISFPTTCCLFQAWMKKIVLTPPQSLCTVWRGFLLSSPTDIFCQTSVQKDWIEISQSLQNSLIDSQVHPQVKSILEMNT